MELTRASPNVSNEKEQKFDDSCCQRASPHMKQQKGRIQRVLTLHVLSWWQQDHDASRTLCQANAWPEFQNLHYLKLLHDATYKYMQLITAPSLHHHYKQTGMLASLTFWFRPAVSGNKWKESLKSSRSFFHHASAKGKRVPWFLWDPHLPPVYPAVARWTPEVWANKRCGVQNHPCKAKMHHLDSIGRLTAAHVLP